jgi:hypothetical protein
MTRYLTIKSQSSVEFSGKLSKFAKEGWTVHSFTAVNEFNVITYVALLELKV